VYYPAVIGISLNGINAGTVISGDEIVDPWSNTQSVVYGIRIIPTGSGGSVLSIGDIEAYHINKSATVLLTSANGRAIDFGSDTTNAITLGTLHTDATTPVVSQAASGVTTFLPAPVISMPNVPTSGTASGSACFTSTGQIYKKTTTGACL
jgi:hypothetical protein